MLMGIDPLTLRDNVLERIADPRERKRLLFPFHPHLILTFRVHVCSISWSGSYGSMAFNLGLYRINLRNSIAALDRVTGAILSATANNSETDSSGARENKPLRMRLLPE